MLLQSFLILQYLKYNGFSVIIWLINLIRQYVLNMLSHNTNQYSKLKLNQKLLIYWWQFVDMGYLKEKWNDKWDYNIEWCKVSNQRVVSVGPHQPITSTITGTRDLSLLGACQTIIDFILLPN